MFKGKLTEKVFAILLAMTLLVTSINIDINKVKAKQALGVNVAKNAKLDIPDMDDNTSKIIDGDLRNGWQAPLKSEDPENREDRQDWILDLKENYKIDVINLYWETSCATKYDVLVSTDKDNWTEVATITDGMPGTKQIKFEAVTARYVKLALRTRSLNYGYNLYEIEVFTVGSTQEELTENLALSATATADEEVGGNTADKVNDNNEQTIWQTKKRVDYEYDVTDEQLTNHNVTLEWSSQVAFDRVVVSWAGGYMRGYVVEISNDNETWETIFDSTKLITSYGKANDIKNIKLDHAVTAKYLRLRGTIFGEWCFEVREIKVFNETNIKAKEIFFDTEDLKLNIDGGTAAEYTLDAYVNPSNTYNKKLIWSSDNDNVAKVDSSGKITAVGVGKCKIKARSEVNENVYKECNVTVNQYLDKPVVTAGRVQKEKSIGVSWSAVKNAKEYEVYRYKDNGGVELIYSGTKTSLVDENLAVGTYRYEVVAKTNGGYYDDTHSELSEGVLIPVDASGITITNKVNTINVGKSLYLSADVAPINASNTKKYWRSTNKNVIEVDEETGLITAVAEGKATIIVRSDDGSFEDSVEITATPIRVYSLYFIDNKETEISKTIRVNETCKLDFSILPIDATYKDVKWENTDPSVATVSKDGEVKGLKSGRTILTATVDGKIISATIDVYDTPASVVLNATTLNLKPGNTAKLIAKVYPQLVDSNALKWTSYDATVVTVDKNGNLVAVGEGTTTIEVRTLSGDKTAKCIVTVAKDKKPSAVTGLKLKKKYKKKAKITWKLNKVSDNVAGYEIAYTLDKKFKKKIRRKNLLLAKFVKAKKVYTLKGLKSKKTYYVKVRAYKVINGKKLYSAYKALKKFKTK